MDEPVTPDLEGYRKDFAAGLRAPGDNLLLFASVDSTNRLARAMASASLDRAGVVQPFVVAALEQTAGRGRQGRSWSSGMGLGIYVSLLVPAVASGALSRLPLLAGVALCRGLEELVPGKCRLKWPNDLMVDGRKIGGILIETVGGAGREPAAVLGFGVNQRHRRSELPTPEATSLEASGGRRVPPGGLTGRLVRSLLAELEHLDERGHALAAYSERSLHEPGDILICRTPKREIRGRFAGFGQDGSLRLETAEGIERISSGEVWDLPGTTRREAS